MKNKKLGGLILLSFSLILILNFNKVYPQSTPQLLPGFPKLIEHTLRPNSFYTTPITADFNNDGYKEILISTGFYSNNLTKLYLVKHNGDIVKNWPKVIPLAHTSATAAGDVNGDGFIDAVLKTEDSLYVFNYNGTLHNGFPVATDNPLLSYVFVSLYDFDGDGKLEIVTNKYNELYVFNFNGTIKNGWPKILNLGETWLGPVSIGDLNNDDIAEIILYSGGRMSYSKIKDSVQMNVFSADGNILPNWPVVLDSGFTFTLNTYANVFKDIDHDSSYIVTNSYYENSYQNRLNRVSTYNYNGDLLRKYSFTSYGAPFGISLGDFNGDGILEHAFGTGYDSSHLYTREGIFLSSFYKCRGSENKTLAIGKLTNDMNIISSPSIAMHDSGYIYGYYRDGNPLEWSPLRFYGMAKGSVTFSDINNDGLVDMVVAVGGVDGCPGPPTKTYVYVWTFPGVTFSYDNFPWPMYGHDRYRTFQYGFIPPDELAGINTISNNLPDKFYLYQNYPNPFNPSTSIRFDVPSSSFVKITVYNILGKEIATLINEKLRAGTYEVEWPAPTGDASNYPSGVYFYRIVVHSDKLKTGEFSDIKRMVLVK